MFVGLTGGIGSGKTTVAHLFKSHGAHVVYADEIAQNLIQNDVQIRELILHRFGQQILSDRGEIDRQKLAKIVFDNAEALLDLEQIVHPKVASEVDVIRKSFAPDDIVIYESALLVDKGINQQCDAVVVVTAETDVRLARLKARGFDTDEARARMANQLDDSARIEVADYVIDNSGSLYDLTERVEHVWSDLVSRGDAP